MYYGIHSISVGGSGVWKAHTHSKTAVQSMYVVVANHNHAHSTHNSDTLDKIFVQFNTRLTYLAVI